MHSTSELYKQLLADPLTIKETLVRVAGKTYILDESDAESAAIYGGVFQSPSVGGTASRQLDLKFIPRDSLPRMAKLTVSIRLRKGNQVSEEIPKGVFFVDTRETDEETGLMTIHAYDALLLLSSKTVSRDGYAEEGLADPSGWPRSAQSVMSVIARKIGVQIDSRTELDTNISIPYPGARATLKQVASWIAAAHGGNWTITDEGKLRLLPLSFGVDALSILTDEDGNILDYDTRNENKKDNITLGALTAGENYIEIGLSEEQLHIYAPFSGWTKVVFKDTKGNAVAEYGTETGRIMEAVCPFGTAEMAQNLLEKINLDEYKPFEAVNAILDLAVELGDAVEVAGFMSVIYQHDMTLDRLCACNIAAPGENEIDHEFPPDANITQDITIIQEEVLDPLLEGDTQLPGESTAESLYQIGGDAADLIVDRLRTSRRIPKYLASDTSDDRFFDIRESQHEIIAGIYNGGTEQARNPYGELLYWESDPAQGIIGADGYPEKNGKKIHIVTKPTDWPVTVYTYTEQVKGGFSDKQTGETQGGDPIYTPVITMGAGNAAGNNIAHMYKGADGLILNFKANNGRDIGFHATVDGYLDPYGLRRTDRIDFTNWNNGSFTEKVEGDNNDHTFGVEFDEEDKPVRIWDDEHSQNIIWGDHDPATEIFLAGIAVGKQLKGWSAVADFSGILPPAGSWAAVDLWTWAMDNGAPDGYASAAAYADYTAGLDNAQVTDDKKMIWFPTVNDLANSRIILWSYYVPSSSGSTTISSENNFSGEYNYNNGSHGSFRLSFSNIDGKSFRYIAKAYGDTDCYTGLRELSFRAPVTGFYQRHQTPWWSGNVTYGGGPSSVTYNYDSSSSSSRGTYLEGESIANNASSSHQKTCDGYMYFPVFTVIPTAPDWMQVIVRAGNIPGIYGVIQNEVPTKIHEGYIVNEAAKNLYNPITNLVISFEKWAYNYGSRTYTLDDTITVTYGENGITIGDGTETYSIKYLVRAS